MEGAHKYYVFVRMNPPKEDGGDFEMDPKRVYGPFSSSTEAHEYGTPFAQEGFDVEAAVDAKLCDFCSKEEVTWDYPCADFQDDMLNWGSRGHWGACEICHGLIEANEREALAARSLDEFYKNNPQEKHPPAIKRVMLFKIFQLHSAFFEARTAEAYREEEA
jgi:hypothetical protein